MTVKDLIELLSQCEEPSTPVSVRVWDSKPDSEPVFSRCDIREVSEGRGGVQIEVEER